MGKTIYYSLKCVNQHTILWSERHANISIIQYSKICTAKYITRIGKPSVHQRIKLTQTDNFLFGCSYLTEDCEPGCWFSESATMSFYEIFPVLTNS